MHYKKSCSFLLENLIKENPCDFFVPMSNLTKMSFWASWFWHVHFDWVFLVGYFDEFFWLNLFIYLFGIIIYE